METENIPTVPTKVCTKCGVEYPATREYFYAGKDYRFGLRSICKKCNDLESAKWRVKNPENERIRHKKWRSRNPEKSRALIKKWRDENPEKYAYVYTKLNTKKQIGAPPPPELVEIKVLINKTKQLCKTLKN